MQFDTPTGIQRVKQWTSVDSFSESSEDSFQVGSQIIVRRDFDKKDKTVDPSKETIQILSSVDSSETVKTIKSCQIKSNETTPPGLCSHLNQLASSDSTPCDLSAHSWKNDYSTRKGMPPSKGCPSSAKSRSLSARTRSPSLKKSAKLNSKPSTKDVKANNSTKVDSRKIKTQGILSTKGERDKTKGEGRSTQKNHILKRKTLQRNSPSKMLKSLRSQCQISDNVLFEKAMEKRALRSGLKRFRLLKPSRRKVKSKIKKSKSSSRAELQVNHQESSKPMDESSTVIEKVSILFNFLNELLVYEGVDRD